MPIYISENELQEWTYINNNVPTFDTLLDAEITAKASQVKTLMKDTMMIQLKPSHPVTILA